MRMAALWRHFTGAPIQSCSRRAGRARTGGGVDDGRLYSPLAIDLTTQLCDQLLLADIAQQKITATFGQSVYLLLAQRKTGRNLVEE